MLGSSENDHVTINSSIQPTLFHCLFPILFCLSLYISRNLPYQMATLFVLQGESLDLPYILLCTSGALNIVKNKPQVLNAFPCC